MIIRMNSWILTNLSSREGKWKVLKVNGPAKVDGRSKSGRSFDEKSRVLQKVDGSGVNLRKKIKIREFTLVIIVVIPPQKWQF